MDYILLLLRQYPYYLILPISIVEGPIVAIIAAFLASQHFLNIYIAYILIVLGDIIGDILHYWLGLSGRKKIIPKYGKYIGITLEKLKYVEGKFDRNQIWKTIFFGKFTHAPNTIILVAAGVVKANFWMFVLVSALSTMPKALILMTIGWYFGKSYVHIGSYIHNFELIMVGALFISYLIYRFYIKQNTKK